MPKIATIERCIGPYTHTISFLKEQYLQPFGVNNCLYHQSPSKKAYSLKNHTWSVAYNSVPHIRYFHVVCIKEPSPFSKPLQHANHSFHCLLYQCWLGAIHVWSCPSRQNIHKTVNNYWLLNSITKASTIQLYFYNPAEFQKSFVYSLVVREMMVWLVCENLVSYASFQAFIFIDYCESCYEERGDNRMKTVDWREYSTLKVIIMPNREEEVERRHYSIKVTGGCLTNIIQSFSQLDLQIFFTAPKGHNYKKQPYIS